MPVAGFSRTQRRLKRHEAAYVRPWRAVSASLARGQQDWALWLKQASASSGFEESRQKAGNKNPRL